MKKPLIISATALLSALVVSCGSNGTQQQPYEAAAPAPSGAGQSGVQDDVSQKNIVQVAAGSKDHTTLVKAVQQAALVDALSNAGPFTVFAPVNAAFDKLPPGTLEGLMKDAAREQLADILQYHVSVGVFREDMLQDGQRIGQVNGGNITVSRKDNAIIINGKAKVLAVVPASNGLIYVIDDVLLPE